MVTRGGCSFTTKVKNAMAVGASVLIVSTERNGENWKSGGQNHHDWKQWDDNDGQLQPHIPIFEIDEQYASLLRQVYDSGEGVYLNANTKTSKVDNSVEVDLWYSSSLDLGLKLANEFSALSYSFTADHSNKPLFTPRIATYECSDCSPEIKLKDCVSDGLYCAYTPKFTDQYGIDVSKNFEMTGREVIIQGLREKCLHQIITERYKQEGVIFWTMFKYLEKCFVDDGLKAKSLEDCYDWKTVVIDGNEEVQNLNACVDNSFAGKNLEADNAILKADRQWANTIGLLLHPSIVINGRVYYGDVTG